MGGRWANVARMRPFLCACAALIFFLSCVRAAAPEPAPAAAQDLSGLELPITSRPSLALAVEGSIQGRSATAVLDLTAPMSLVRSSCFPGGPPKPRARVRIERAGGGFAELPQILLSGARVGPRALPPLDAALIEGSGPCAFAVGLDVLGHYALIVDPQERTVRFEPPRDRAAYRAMATDGGLEDLSIVELSRDPETDRLLVPVRVRQWSRELVASLVLSSADARTFLSEKVASRAGFETDSALAARLDQPEVSAGELPPIPTYSLDELDLGEGLPVRGITAVGEPNWTQPESAGALGADAWARFPAIVDPSAHVLVLRRPKAVAGRGDRCLGPEGESEEACFVLSASPRPDGGLLLAATSWRALPTGGQLYVDPLLPDGGTVSRTCRVGISFEAGADRGATTAASLPWPSLDEVSPPCAAELRKAQAARLGLFEDGTSRECPGRCAFVLFGRRSWSCGECPLLPGSASRDQERAVQFLRLVRASGTPPDAGAQAPEPEPQD